MIKKPGNDAKYVLMHASAKKPTLKGIAMTN